MAISHDTKVYGVEDCKIAVLLTDPAAGTATYGTLIDVPGIKTVEITGTVDSKSLRGDNQLLDQNSTVTDISVAISHAKLSLDVLEAITGGTTTDSGSGTDEVAEFELLGTDSLAYFKLEAITPTGGADQVGGAVHFVLPKLMIDSFPSVGHAEEDYRIVSFSAKASPRISDSQWILTRILETKQNIS